MRMEGIKIEDSVYNGIGNTFGWSVSSRYTMDLSGTPHSAIHHHH